MLYKLDYITKYTYWLRCFGNLRFSRRFTDRRANHYQRNYQGLPRCLRP